MTNSLGTAGAADSNAEQAASPVTSARRNFMATVYRADCRSVLLCSAPASGSSRHHSSPDADPDIPIARAPCGNSLSGILARPMRAVDVIMKKRDGGALDRGEIEFFVKGVTAGSLPDYQAAALLMAIVLRGMTPEETAWL